MPHWDWTQVMRDMSRFIDRLSYTLKKTGAVPEGRRMAYAYAVELHPGGHGLHIHLAVDRSIPRHLLLTAWGHGGVYASKLRKSRSKRETARAVADYMTKEFGRTTEALREAGVIIRNRARRYEVARGFLPRVVRAIHRTIEGGREWLLGCGGGEVPITEFSSADIVDWNGPPFTWMAWL